MWFICLYHGSCKSSKESTKQSASVDSVWMRDRRISFRAHHVLHSIFESCTRRSQSAFLQGSCWHGQRRRSRGCQVARDGDAPWIEAQGSHLLELLRKNTHSAGPSGNHRISSRTASPRWWALLVRTIRSFRSGFAAVSQNFCRQHFFGSPCHQTFDNARTLDKARAAENSPPYPAQSHAHSTAVAALPASQRSVTCSEVWAALPSACYKSSILSECFIAADSTNILLSMGRYELPWTLNPKPFSYVSLILYMKDHLWRRFPRRVCMFSWAGWVGAWAGLEIDDLGGSTAMTSNFYLSLSWGFRI